MSGAYQHRAAIFGCACTEDLCIQRGGVVLMSHPRWMDTFGLILISIIGFFTIARCGWKRGKYSDVSIDSYYQKCPSNVKQ